MEGSQPSVGEDNGKSPQDSPSCQARARLSPFTENAVAEIATSRAESAVGASRLRATETGVNGAQ